MTLRDRLTGAVYGLLIGDALGVPYEFHPPDDIPPLEQIEFRPPRRFSRSHSSVPPGTWSDDGAQALCLLASLLECGRLDLDDLGRRLLSWMDEGYCAVDRNVFDVGITTSRALASLRLGARAVDAGQKDQSSNGNGSLMRVLPLAIWHTGSDDELADDAMKQSLVTHGHLRSQVCCALYCLWARNILREGSSPWEDATVSFRAIYSENSAVSEELEWSIRPDDPPSGSGSGYVVDTLRSARLVMQHDSYERVVREAVRLGNDTDTTACVAGGVAGLRDGFDAIPVRWRDSLRGREIVDPLVTKLLERLGA